MLIYVVLSLTWPVFFLNKVVFAFIILLLLLKSNKIRIESFAPFIIVVIYIYSANLALFTSVNFDPDHFKQMLLFPLTFFLIYYIRLFRVDMDNLVVQSGIIFSVLSWVMILAKINGISAITSLFDSYSGLASGARSVIDGGESDFYRLGGVPFLLLSLGVITMKMVHQFKVRYLLIIILFLSVTFASTSRANILLSLFLLVSLYVYRYPKSLGAFCSLLILTSLTLWFDEFSIFLIKFISMFDFSEMSNAVKLKSLISFFDLLNWNIFLFGEGLSTYFYSPGVGKFMSHNEITIIDNIRYFGFPLTCLFYFVLFCPDLKIKRDFFNRHTFVFFLYILGSLSNPNLLNSYGVIVILWYWNFCLQRKDY
jgi:hypothetical protein